MEAKEYLVHGCSSPAFQAELGWRGFIEALMTRLMKVWVGLYGTPPGRLPPML